MVYEPVSGWLTAAYTVVRTGYETARPLYDEWRRLEKEKAMTRSQALIDSINAKQRSIMERIETLQKGTAGTQQKEALVKAAAVGVVGLLIVGILSFR